MMRSNNALENGRSQASLRSIARAVQRGRYGPPEANKLSGIESTS
jgi:hypothetical protein